MNKLPQMPIRAKYADEFTEGSPAAKSISDILADLAAKGVDITALKAAVQALEDGTAKVLEVEEIEPLTTENCNAIASGNYIAVKCNGEYYIIDLYSDEYFGIYLFSSEENVIYSYFYYFNDDEWLYNYNITFAGVLLRQNPDEAGRVLTLNNNGEPGWAALPAAGTKLYRHSIAYNLNNPSYPSNTLYVISTSSEPISKSTTSSSSLGTIIAVWTIQGIVGAAVNLDVIAAGGGAPRLQLQYIDVTETTLAYSVADLSASQFWVDTVTAL